MITDIRAILQEMLLSARTELAGSGRKALSTVENFVHGNAERYKDLIAMRLSGSINDEELKMYLNNEQRMLEVQLNSLEIISLSCIQKTLNGMTDVFLKAVTALLPL